MIKKNWVTAKNGFTLVEVIVSIAIFGIIMMAIILSFTVLNVSSSKSTADSYVVNSAQRVLDSIAFETRMAKGIYTPTTTSTQLSLETSRYLPQEQSTTYVDFFLCGQAICMKKEFQNAFALTPDTVKVTNLLFAQVSTSQQQSVKISMTISYSGPLQNQSEITLSSVASIRNYQD